MSCHVMQAHQSSIQQNVWRGVIATPRLFPACFGLLQLSAAQLQLSSSPLTPACIDSRRQRNEEDVPTPCGLRPSSPTRSVRRPCAEHRGNLRQPQASFAPPSLNLSPQCESRRPQFAYRLEIFLVFGLDFVEAFVFYFDFLGWI